MNPSASGVSPVAALVACSAPGVVESPDADAAVEGASPDTLAAIGELGGLVTEVLAEEGVAVVEEAVAEEGHTEEAAAAAPTEEEVAPQEEAGAGEEERERFSSFSKPRTSMLPTFAGGAGGGRKSIMEKFADEVDEKPAAAKPEVCSPPLC